MKRVVVAVMLLAACRGGKARKDADLRGSASAVSAPAVPPSVVPKLPISEDGAAELQRLDRRIAQLATSTQDARALAQSITLHLDRAALRGRLEDYERAVADSATLVEQSPKSDEAWRLRFQALARVHDIAGARAALQQLAKLTNESLLVEHEIALADLTGDTARALAGREQAVKQFPSAHNLTVLAATLASVGRVDEAVALIPKAAAAVRDNPPALLAWLLFQWGRIYEHKGELATARAFFAASRERVPGYLEATSHLAAALIATGDAAAAKELVEAALADNRHPELLALAVQLGRSELADEARTAWERYVTALPLAFADHAARFYLGAGKHPARALELARINHRNRDTKDARALVVEAALAAGDPEAACAVVDPLASGGTRAQRFLAWQALSRCGRTADAARLGRELGIGP